MSQSKDHLLKFIKLLKNSCYGSKISTWAALYNDPRPSFEIRINVPKVIRTFFKEKGKLHLLDNIPKQYMKRTSVKDYCVIVDPKIAKRIGHAICSRFDGNYLIEFDAGLGYMSDILITSTPHLWLCETNPEFRANLEIFRLKHGDKVKIHDISFSMLIRSLMSRNICLIGKKEAFFDKLPKRSWKDAPNISFILICERKQLIRDICRRMVLDRNLHKFGRLEFYCLIPTYIHQKLIATPNNEFKKLYGSTAVLFQVVFDFEVLLEDLPRWTILPWPSIKKRDKSNDMVLLRAIPKVNFFDTFKKKMLIRCFFNFINDNMHKNKRIIPILETYIANCGPPFIMNYNLTSYSQFLELPSNEILSLFLRLSKLPSFNHSAQYLSEKSVSYFTDDESDNEEENIT